MSAYHSLYAADTELVLQYVREIDEGVSSALLVGHNPTVFDVAWRLLAESDDPDDPAADRKILEARGFPTCALAVLSSRWAAGRTWSSDPAPWPGCSEPPY